MNDKISATNETQSASPLCKATVVGAAKAVAYALKTLGAKVNSNP